MKDCYKKCAKFRDEMLLKELVIFLTGDYKIFLYVGQISFDGSLKIVTLIITIVDTTNEIFYFALQFTLYKISCN